MGSHLFLRDRNGRAVKDVAKELAQTNGPLEVIYLLRQHFPELSLIEAKELMIIATTEFGSLEEYQANLFGSLDDEASNDGPTMEGDK
ncbi:hypothetical protein [Flaviaesturariibacter amylovorans]|uniref:Uncharacterized protein n=1 Tax=Flaviaesturariibacter amylovorans TaxID=1084520 RepID=A0ABP8H4G9_9BACT